MIIQYSNFKYGDVQVSKIYQGETLVWPPDSSIIYNIPTPIDLGLSVKWASFNLGASMPTEYGYRYAWGETSPKATYDWDTYIWCMGTSTTLTKYNDNSSCGVVDNKEVLDLEDDAAHVNLGGTWRIPTREEWQELIDNCTWTWGYQGNQGMLVTSNIPGYTNNSIFLPALIDVDWMPGKRDYLWSSTVRNNNNIIYNGRAWAIYYRNEYTQPGDDLDAPAEWISGKAIDTLIRARGVYSKYWEESYGAGIRPVCP